MPAPIAFETYVKNTIKIKGPLPTLCWIWQGTIKNGYGTFMQKRKRWYSHRMSYETYKGPIPEGHGVFHHCDNTACINPDHLFTGLQKDNVADCNKKRRHAHGETTGTSKLTNPQVLEIRHSKEIDRKILAEKYGVSPYTITLIKKGKIWKHL